jgi:hypothetical protein
VDERLFLTRHNIIPMLQEAGGFDASKHPRGAKGRWTAADAANHAAQHMLNDRQAEYHEYGPGQDSGVFGDAHPGVQALLSQDELSGGNQLEIGNALTRLDSSRVIVTRGDRLDAVAAWSAHDDAIFLDHVGSLVRGGGSRALLPVVRDALTSGKPLEFESTDSATGFYDKLGFTRDAARGTNWFKTPAEQLIHVVDRITGRTK